MSFTPYFVPFNMLSTGDELKISMSLLNALFMQIDVISKFQNITQCIVDNTFFSYRKGE